MNDIKFLYSKSELKKDKTNPEIIRQAINSSSIKEHPGAAKILSDFITVYSRRAGTKKGVIMLSDIILKWETKGSNAILFFSVKKVNLFRKLSFYLFN